MPGRTCFVVGQTIFLFIIFGYKSNTYMAESTYTIAAGCTHIGATDGTVSHYGDNWC